MPVASPTPRRAKTVVVGEAPAGVRHLRAVLVEFRGPEDPGSCHFLREGRNAIGRDDECEVRLDHPSVSKAHAFIYLDVKDESGKVVEWSVEMMSLNHLKSYGWTRTTVKPGDVISCTGGAAKSGDPAMISSLMKLVDGRMIKS